MPLYTYRCTKCHREFEVLAPPGKTPASCACIHCGEKRTVPTFGAFGVHMHGAGNASKPAPGCSKGDCSACPLNP